MVKPRKVLALGTLLMLGVTTATATKVSWPTGGLWDRGAPSISVAASLEDALY